MMKCRWTSAQTLLMALIFIGFGLRVHQLGQKSFWNDEAGVALVAVTPTLTDFLAGVRTHAAAMPLDYGVVWLMARWGVQEFYLLFPALLWGTLTLPLFYQLCRAWSSTRTALLAVGLLVLSPLHLQYSQELRFYTSLVFFYLWATISLYRALQYPSLRRWVVFTLVTMSGVYFHVYVLLSFVNGLVWLAQAPRSIWQTRWRGMAVSGALLGAALLPGYLYFMASQHFDYDLWRWQSFLSSVVHGLGWFPPSYSRAWGWGIGCLFLGSVGLWVSLRRPGWLCFWISLSVALQIGIILILDAWKGYWFGARQLLPLLPLVLCGAALGLSQIFEWAHHWMPQWQKWVALSIVGGMLLLSTSAVADYYGWPKSVARSTTEMLLERWSSGESIFITPSYEEKIYRFYWQFVFGRAEIASAIQTGSVAELSSTRLPTYVIVDEALSHDNLLTLTALGYQALTVPTAPLDWKEQVFVRLSP